MLLNVHSWYSLRYGTMSCDQLVGQMQQYGYNTAVLTDINNSSGSLEFLKKCAEAGLKALAGMEFRNDDELLFIAVAKNNDGFEEINRYRSEANYQQQKIASRAPEFDNVFVIYPYGKKAISELRPFEYIGIQAAQLNKIVFEPRQNDERYVIWHPVTFKEASEFKLHCQLRAIDHNLLISQLQRHQAAGRDELFIPKAALLQAYSAFPEIISATERLFSNCQFSFDFGTVKNKTHFFSSATEDREKLRKWAFEGLERRYSEEQKEKAKERMENELKIIFDQEFASYFLITNDICQYAKRQGHHHVGRGSGANSIVAYCLGITDVCPLELNLYFERFLNPKRKIPPDFDIDFSWAIRDEMYAYIFEKYPGRVALLGAMSTFRSRSMKRELGKIYGLPKSEIDRMVNDKDHMLNKNEVVDMINNVCNQMADFPNQRTIHASGVLISELPLTYYSALDYPPKSLPTTQFDMHIAEKIGFEKFDILSQRGLGHIKDCVEIIKENKGEDIDVHRAKDFIKDPHIAAQLRSANTIGCFYIESPAMRQLIAKLDCKDYLTLVAASSIIRPGVASSGMMGTYIERHRHPEKEINYLHPVMKRELEETYGVMVYQEDVMRIGHHYGGLDLGDADVLRRMMSGKARDQKRMEEIEQKFFRHCAEMNYEERTSREIWRQMESFAGFSFNKAHSASYAVESYQSLYLKTYFPMEFMVAVLNNYGGFYQRKVYVNEVKRAGATLRLPCVNNSLHHACIKGADVYLGYDCLMNLEQQYVRSIPNELKENGPFYSLENFILRTGISLEQIIILIRAGAFHFTGCGKKELLWEAHLLLSNANKKKKEAMLFLEEGSEKPVLPELETSTVEDLYDEIELIGFPISGTMFDLVKTDFRGEVMAKDLVQYEGKTVRMAGDFVCDKQLNTKNGQLMKFGTFFDAEGTFFDTVHFPPSLKQYPFRGNGVYLILGKVVLDFGYPAIEVEKIARLPMWPDPRSI